MTLERDATGFRAGTTEHGRRFWIDRSGKRLVLRVAPNRFQAFEDADGEMLSVGYLMSPDDTRLYLSGFSVEIATWFRFRSDPQTFRHPSLTTF